MLSNIIINSQPLSRPQSAKLPPRFYGSGHSNSNSNGYGSNLAAQNQNQNQSGTRNGSKHANNINNPNGIFCRINTLSGDTCQQVLVIQGLENCQSTYLHNDKVILPVKEYSNKFLRQSKQKQQNQHNFYNHCLFKPKKSFLQTRKQLKTRKIRQSRPVTNQNESQPRTFKTESSFLLNDTHLEPSKSIRSPQTPLERCFSTPNNKNRDKEKDKEKQKISASRALELFSKVFRNQNIERLKIRKQIISRQLDVQVKQVKLQMQDGKEKGNGGDREREKEKGRKIGANRKSNLHPSSILQKSKKDNKSLFMDQDNFQLVGW